MSTGFTRRSLAAGIGTAGLGLGGSALLGPNALADTPFTSFAFQATGEPTARTMPDRLAEIKNVLDFGADPTGASDSSTAIQNAVNWTTGANRGTIYFPLGAYQVNKPITFNYNGNLSICFRGETNGSFIFGNVNGYIFDRSLVTPNNTTGMRIFEKLNIQNANTSANTGAIRMGSTDGGCVRDCVLRGFNAVTTEDSVGNSSRNILFQNVKVTGAQVPGCGGFIIGGSGAMTGCGFTSCDVAVRLYGGGFCMSGNRIERCNTAYLLGLDSGGNNLGLSGFSLTSGSTEGNWTAIDFGGICTGFLISSIGMLGHDKSNAGMVPNLQDSQYGIIVRANNAQAGVFSGLTGSQWFDVACFEIDVASSRANLLFVGCNGSAGAGSGVAWITPNNAYTAQFQNCNVQPIWTYSALPTGGNVLEGDEFNISDSTTAAWGANVTTGGGSHRVRIRYNGTNWTVMG
jgi:hypothetical protein